MIRISHFKGNLDSHVIMVDKKDMDAFRKLVQRGAQTWTDAPPAIKEFADLVTSGIVMQPYHNMSSEKHTEVSNVYLDAAE